MSCDSLVISCIDFRIQAYIEDWLRANLGVGNYDRVAIAGGVHDLEYLLKQVQTSVRLHKIKKVILINHEDCGAYKKEGTQQRHKNDLKKAKKEIKSLNFSLVVEKYYLTLNGTFEKIL